MSDTPERIVVKPTRKGRLHVYGIYDRHNASWPQQLPGFGRVAQDHRDAAAAQAVADALNQFYADKPRERIIK